MTKIYGNQTAAEILSEFLGKIRDDVDKREGAIVFDMVAGPAQRHELLNYELDAIMLQGFGDTAVGDELERRAKEHGVDRKQAIKARGFVTFRGMNNAPIPEGTQVFTDFGTAFITLKNGVITDNKADIEVEALVAGEEGNVGIGEITQIPTGLGAVTSVTNNAVFTSGVDEESDDALRERYLLKVRKPITSGNPYHYRLWATSVEGVATARVFPLWNGPGTVKVVVIAADGGSPDASVVANVAAHIEQERPIGATVTVLAIAERPITVSATLILAGDLTVADVLDAVTASISAYLLSETDNEVVRYTRVGEAILDVVGVLDYEGLLIDGTNANITFSDEEVPVLGAVTFV